jgi:hypothetical protein
MPVFIFITTGMKRNSTSISVTVLRMGVEPGLRILYIFNIFNQWLKAT